MLHDSTPMECPENTSLEREKVDWWRLGLGVGGEWENWGGMAKGCESLRNDDVLPIVMMGSQLCEYVKSHCIAQFKWAMCGL